MREFALIKGQRVKIGNTTVVCDGKWCRGGEIIKYDFISSDGHKFSRPYEYVQKLLNERIIIKI